MKLKHRFKSVRLCLFLCIFTFANTYSSAQSFNDLPKLDKLLNEIGINFLMPVENQFSISKSKKNKFFKYDFKMVDRSKEIETLIALIPDDESSLMNFPHIKFQNLLANLTPNTDRQQVPVYSWGEKELKERNADWGAEAYFTAREEITKFPHTKLIAFYKEGRGMVVMAHCFDDPKVRSPKFIEFLIEEE